MNALVVGSAIVVLLWLLIALTLPRGLKRLVRVDATLRAPSETNLSVIIPARNEEHALPQCLAALAAQDEPAHEIIVVDDQSTDGTSAVARAHGVRVVASTPRPDDWVGKNWAAWQGARAASGKLLLFLDADMTLAPAALRATLAQFENDCADVLSVMARNECATRFEELFQPIMLLLVLWQLDPEKVNDPSKPDAAASGAFFLFRREAYDRIGGHEAVRNEIVEDLKLAQRAKARGLKLRFVAAPHLVSARRPRSARALLSSWVRVTVDGLGRKPWLALLGLFGVLAFFVGPYIVAPFGEILLGLAGAHLVCVRVVRAQLAHALGVDDRLAWLQPLGALIVVALLARVFLATIGVGANVRWHGRTYRA